MRCGVTSVLTSCHDFILIREYIYNVVATKNTVRVRSQIPVVDLTGQARSGPVAVPGAGFSGQNLRIYILCVGAH